MEQITRFEQVATEASMKATKMVCVWMKCIYEIPKDRGRQAQKILPNNQGVL